MMRSDAWKGVLVIVAVYASLLTGIAVVAGFGYVNAAHDDGIEVGYRQCVMDEAGEYE